MGRRSSKPRYRFNKDEADRAVRFFERILKHTEGRYAGAPFILTPWQCDDIVRPLFGWQRFDEQWGEWVRKYTQAWIEVPRGNGKALALDTPVPTPTGWSTQGALEVGDEIFDGEGRPTKVVAVTNVMQGRPCYRVTFSDGESILADAGHLWLTRVSYQGQSGRYIWSLRNTEEIFKTQTYGVRGDRRHAVAVAPALTLPDLELPIDPYVLGLWLGDGTTAGGSITTADPGIIEAIEAAGYATTSYASHSPYAFGIYGLKAQLRDLGVLGNKHIPERYLRASEFQRLALLQGLMDTDGSITSRGVESNITQCEFTSINEQLANQTLELMRTLGFKATVKSARVRFAGKDHGLKYRILFTSHSDRPVFRLPRKLERMRPPPAKQSSTRSRTIALVEPVESAPVKCIQVENKDGMYLVGRSFIPTHNSELAAGFELQGLCADGEYGAECYGGAEDRDQASIVYRVVAAMVDMSPTLKKRLKVVESKKRIIDPKTNSFYQVLPRDEMGTGAQGFKVHRAVIDEVHVQRTKAFMSAMKKGLGKRTQPMLVMITTAGDDPSSPAGEEHEYALKLLEDPELNPSYFVYMKTPPKEVEADPFNEKYWFDMNPALGDFLSIQTLRDEAKEATEKPSELNDFLRFRLNLWVKQNVRWLPMDKWDATAGMVVEDKLQGKECFAGLHLTASTDIASWILDLPDGKGGHDILCRFWAPEARLEDLRRRTHNQVDVWVDEGFLELTSGDVIDYQAIRSTIDKDARDFDIQEVGYHRWGVTQLATELDDAGLTVVPVTTGIASSGPPTKELERLVYEKKYRHGGNPVMWWMVNNIGIKKDSEGNIKIDPQKSADTVTGPIAAVMALDRALRTDQSDAESMIH